MSKEASISAFSQCAVILAPVSVSLGLLALSLLLALWGERIAVRYLGEARPPAPSHVRFNIRYSLVSNAVVSMIQPMVAGISLTMTRTLGEGWIAFPAGLIGWCLAFVSALLISDMIEYLFHRAQHRFPLLWKMHELHHSAEHFDVTVTYRNFWIEPLIKSACLYPLVGVLLKVPPSVGMAVAIVFALNNNLVHMNVRFAPARYPWALNNPQVHRLHHSRDPADYDRNFGAMFLIWDHMFGTFRQPAHDQFPDVGLDSGDAPRKLFHALLWPWCRGQQRA